MKFILFFLAVAFPSLALAQKPTKVDSAQIEAHIQMPLKEAEPPLDEFIEVSEEPKPLQNIQALVEYPEKAKRSGLEGRVTFSALIGKDGIVKKISIDHADYDIFRQPVIDAMQKVRFTPAKNGDKPVMVWYTQSIVFKLKPAEDEQEYH